jgi:hypothetical protein
MSAVIRWIAPFFASPYKWQFQQINGAVGDAPMAMLAASVRLTDEEGIAAAAYTIMQAPGESIPPEQEVDFVLDRPFIFVITSRDGLPMFAGVVNDP